MIGKLLKKKQGGNIGDILSFGVFLMFYMVLMMAVINFMIILNFKDTCDQISRQYIIYMETKGTADKNEIIETYADAGYTPKTVTVNNGAANPIPFGSKVTLSIEVTASSAELGLYHLPGFPENWTYQNSRHSISKAR